MAKKKQSMEFLREKAHLRSRTNTIGAVARIRNALAFATHRWERSQHGVPWQHWMLSSNRSSSSSSGSSTLSTSKALVLRLQRTRLSTMKVYLLLQPNSSAQAAPIQQ
jgi:aspartyl/asparaginyl-tRNA synthetase